jgi:hypothetical protein
MTIYRWAWFALAVLGVVASLYVYARLHRYEWRGELVLDHWRGELCIAAKARSCAPVRGWPKQAHLPDNPFAFPGDTL